MQNAKLIILNILCIYLIIKNNLFLRKTIKLIDIFCIYSTISNRNEVCEKNIKKSND